jgi:hypothetical protein
MKRGGNVEISYLKPQNLVIERAGSGSSLAWQSGTGSGKNKCGSEILLSASLFFPASKILWNLMFNVQSFRKNVGIEPRFLPHLLGFATKHFQSHKLRWQHPGLLPASLNK